MKVKQWIAINKNGRIRTRSNKPTLEWNEIAMQLSLDIPNELFTRPHIEATLQVKDVPNNVYMPEIIVNTKELIEQQTGAKIDFKIIPINDEEK